MLLKLDLNWLHQISPVTVGSYAKLPRPRNILGLSLAKRVRLAVDMLAVRLPMSPDAAKEKDEDGAWTNNTGRIAAVADKTLSVIKAVTRLILKNLDHSRVSERLLIL